MRLIALFCLLVVSYSAYAEDRLVVISPHRKSLQEAFIPAFKTYYKKKFGTDVLVDWLDQGGTSDDMRFIRSKFAKNPKTSGLDVFWGGGAAVYLDLHEEGLLAPYKLTTAQRAELPKDASGIPLTNENETFHASAMSSFGIFYNKKILAFDGLKAAQKWDDLASAELFDNISLADPRRSGSANTMNNIILQSLGWEKGFEVLTAIGGNARSFTHSSSDPIKAVVAGDVAMAMAIDFYALAKIDELGHNNLGLTLPDGQTVLDPDPIAILKGAPNRKVAERFVDFVLSSTAQKVLILPKGAPSGPKGQSIGRFAVNRKSYQETNGKRLNPINPFDAKGFFKYDAHKAGAMQKILNDLMGAMIVDNHASLKRAWQKVIKDGVTPEELSRIGKVPVSEAEFLKLSERWSDDVFRNRVINEWVEFARKKYQALAH